MKVYISSHKRILAEELSAMLLANSHEVVSDWHGSGWQDASSMSVEEKQRRAALNTIQIERSDVLVMFGGTEIVPGGKYIELGYALALKKKCFIIGSVGNLMSNHHDFIHVNEVSDFLSAIRPVS